MTTLEDIETCARIVVLLTVAMCLVYVAHAVVCVVNRKSNNIASLASTINTGIQEVTGLWDNTQKALRDELQQKIRHE
jgi:predicted PurR-regulated permease PerM